MTRKRHGLVLKNKDRENIDWQNVVIPRIAQLLDQYIAREGHKPTLRTMYYVGLDEGLYPGVLGSYKGLSAAIVTAKKAGRFREDAFTDNTRFVWADFRTRDKYITQEAWIDDQIDILKNADIYFTFPKWRNQPYHVVAALEKNTLFGVFKNILEEEEVPIIVNRGNRGYQFLTDTFNDLEEFYNELGVRKCTHSDSFGNNCGNNAKYYNELNEGLDEELDDEYVCEECKIEHVEKYKDLGLVPRWSDIESVEKIIILYFGDCDPSGDNMSVTLTADIYNRNLQSYVTLERVAVTFKQIVDHRLHFFPQDLGTMVKLLGDPNIERFSRKLRTSPYYPIIKAQLDSDPEYAVLKSKLMDHPIIVNRLKNKARRYHKDYEVLRAEELRKIQSCDFIIFELDALVAKQHDLLKKIVLGAVKQYFNKDIYSQELEKHKAGRIQGLVNKKVKFLDGDN